MTGKIRVFLSILVAASTYLAQSFAGPSHSNLDQSFTGPLDGVYVSIAEIVPMAQVYTAGITGELTSVEISVSTQNGGPVVVEILDPTSQTDATWSLLGYTMITPPEQSSSWCSPTCQLVSASFSPPIPQIAGKQYAIAVYPAYITQQWYGSTGSNRYAGGGTYIRGPSWVDITTLYPSLPSSEQIASFYFQTYVQPSRKK